jgi:hypothetical protein
LIIRLLRFKFVSSLEGGLTSPNSGQAVAAFGGKEGDKFNLVNQDFNKIKIN